MSIAFLLLFGYFSYKLTCFPDQTLWDFPEVPPSAVIVTRKGYLSTRIVLTALCGKMSRMHSTAADISCWPPSHPRLYRKTETKEQKLAHFRKSTFIAILLQSSFLATSPWQAWVNLRKRLWTLDSGIACCSVCCQQRWGYYELFFYVLSRFGYPIQIYLLWPLCGFCNILKVSLYRTFATERWSPKGRVNSKQVLVNGLKQSIQYKDAKQTTSPSPPCCRVRLQRVSLLISPQQIQYRLCLWFRPNQQSILLNSTVLCLLP